MRLDPACAEDVSECPPPRIGLRVAHAGLRRDLERALVSAGCRVFVLGTQVPHAEGLRLDALVGDPAAAAVDEAGAIDAAAAVEADACAVAVWPADANGPGRSDRVEVLSKPFSVADLERSLARVLEPSRPGRDRLDPVLASQDRALRAALLRARRLAEQGRSLVVEGELGVGRRALARAVHEWSDRADGPFVVLDRIELAAAHPDEACARIDEAWASAGIGTLVAIEPAEWTPAAQQALLARLRAGKGACLVTLVSEPLESSVERGRCARELADRLDVSRIRLPALRDRPMDQRAVCEAVARRVARRLGRETPELDDATIAEWADEGFPGNLLGVESRLRSALLREDVTQAALLDVKRHAATEASLDLKRHAATEASLDLKSLERDTIVRALAHWQGNRTRASESLGISVRTLRNKIREYGLR